MNFNEVTDDSSELNHSELLDKNEVTDDSSELNHSELLDKDLPDSPHCESSQWISCCSCCMDVSNDGNYFSLKVNIHKNT